MKIEKVNEEISRVKAKISEFQAKLRELERQKTELENTAIVELVRGLNATPEEIKALVLAFKEQNGTKQTDYSKEETDLEK